MSNKRLPSSGTIAPDSIAVTASDELPPALATALSDAEEMLTQRDRVYSVMRETHDSVPKLHRERLTAEIRAAQAEVNGSNPQAKDHLTQIETRLADAKRKRNGAVMALMTDPAFGKAVLDKARNAIVEAQREYAEATIAEFQSRLEVHVAELQRLWRWGDELATALGVPIPMPVPAVVSTHVRRKGLIDRLDGPESAVTLPPL